ncbi:hypothetical protein H4R34_001180 [Dimargaris verticillata]|uniref:Uncharacterized protein n=1 Tax=Dimargaris verticillata TaxID=2761393 RepID=A0A9W8BB91_9FUNG|nr:hypothetical protein H4R34_001180 [Dimargaris verticillata]
MRHSVSASFSPYPDSDLGAPPPSSRYAINVGHCTRILRHDLEHLFDGGLRITSIYTRNMVVTEPTHTHLHLQGKRRYLWFVRAVLWGLKWFYRDINFRIIRFEHRPGPWPPSSRASDSSTMDSFRREDNLMTRVSRPINHGGTLESKHIPIANVGAKAGTRLGPRQHELHRIAGPRSPHCTTLFTPSYKVSELLGSGFDVSQGGPVHLYVRWSFEATLRPSTWLPNADFPASRYDGVFVYTFDAGTGWVNQHAIVDIFPAPDQRFIKYLERWWWWALQSPFTSKPA